MSKGLSVEALRDLLVGDGEFALIDPREEADFARGHLLFASNFPLSRIELLIHDAVPNKDTRVVLCDDGGGVSNGALLVLESLGYSNLTWLTGGVPVWALAGGAVFTGVNVPSKAFGEYVEQTLKTPSITAHELKIRLDGGHPTVLLDARPPDEHRDYCIPGATACAAGELPYRGLDALNDADAMVVVHCAGRTRSIIGAQTLIDTGLHEQVFSLENGTPAWEFAGFELEHGSERSLAEPGPEHLKRAQAQAHQTTENWNLDRIELTDLDHWRGGNGTCYLIDVRTAEEFAAGHVSGSRHVPGGQLLQTTERHLATQNAKILLIDSDGVRGLITGMWLRRMGWQNITVTSIDEDDVGLVVDTADPLPQAGHMSVDEAAKLISNDNAVVCDVRSSVSFRKCHVDGAFFLTREDIIRDEKKLPTDAQVILVADDLAYANLIADDLKNLGHTVSILKGGLGAWSEAGHVVSQGVEGLLSRPVDMYLDAEHYDDPKAAMRENHHYLSWEIALIDHIVGDPAVRFNCR